MAESTIVASPEPIAAEQSIAGIKELITQAAQAEDPTLVAAYARSLRSAMWRRDREAQMAGAAADRVARQRTNRELY
jgi:hypothetical protein